ncbi:hypothetical protein [Cohnella thermotolerans]|jgi:cytoskeletal protein CcmA (bactofilin family)|uniref:hypothetical protein n=1 Tax=Cohnella thermotolerans TaxID=329858 RepID=UPI000427E06E|nr:hypothetical protein [Cohnella thermotolerans]
MSGDLRLIGTTQSNGGKFGRVKIVGENELAGRTECESFACTGTSRIKGDLEAGSVKLTGELRVEGRLALRRGTMTGEADIRGNCRGEHLKMTGQLKVQGDLECETCRISGAATVGGLISAERVELRMHGPSEAKEIGGGTITVKPSRVLSIKRMFAAGYAGGLTADLIEGDRLDLEYTNARVVRGNQVRIGPGCTIGRVEYRGSLNRSKSATIGEEEKID